MKKFLVIAAAAGALAFGVPAAIAATDSAETPASTFQPVQQEQQQQPDEAQPRERPNGDDCPEKAGRGGGYGDNSGSAATPDATASPEI
jgi:hypothetical protein